MAAMPPAVLARDPDAAAAAAPDPDTDESTRALSSCSSLLIFLKDMAASLSRAGAAGAGL
jgi:hypothetical protein